MKSWSFVSVLLAAVTVIACGVGAPGGQVAGPADAQAFLTDVNATLLRLGTESQQAAWVSETYITDDTEALNARADQIYTEAVASYAKQAARFDSATLPVAERRQLTLLKTSLEKVTPSDPKEAAE